jgi:hypothetical protein
MTFILSALVILTVAAQEAPGVVSPQVASLVASIQRADYEGDRVALRRLHAELQPFVENRAWRARVQYWRGFALWRSALNGFNESTDLAAIEADLTQCIVDFRAALSDTPGFADVKAGAASCLVNLSFLELKKNGRPSDAARARFVEAATLLKEAEAAEPDNPRVLWVKGPNQWFAPPAAGGGQAAALATYERGLALARSQKRQTAEPLAPSWGEPELLMNLAFSHLNRTTPDLAAAERYAREALALVPHWHYVRDLLLPQIEKAKQPR